MKAAVVVLLITIPRLSGAIDNLLAHALVGKDETMAIPRTIQQQYRDFMSPDDHQRAFCDTSKFLFNVFLKKSTTLYDHCEGFRR